MIPKSHTALYSLLVIGIVSTACTAKPNDKKQTEETLRQRTLNNLIQVKGGQFQMGDFGKLVPETEGLYYSIDANNKPVHTVELSPFSIQKYRVTNQDYDDYLAITGKPDKSFHRDQDSIPDNMKGTDPNTRWPDEATSVNWYEAHDYCEWLGQQIGMLGSLPTEAQWEYAARSEGRLSYLATDNGKAEEGRNIPTREQIKEMHPEDIYNQTIKIGKFPPNPLGLYDVGYGGLEWMQDWYDPNYYQYSPIKDPQGPATGEEKSQRGKRNNEDGYAMKNAQLVFERYHDTPDFYDKKRNKTYFMPGNGMRCVFSLRNG